MGLIRREIKDIPLINLLAKFLKAGYISSLGLVDSELTAKIGTPQGSVLSPLLYNLYLHELDLFVRDVILPRYNLPYSKEHVNKISEKYNEKVTR